MSAVGTAENAALTSIIDAAVEAGIAVVGAAGNKGNGCTFLCTRKYRECLYHRRSDENGARITSSNYGSTIDLT